MIEEMKRLSFVLSAAAAMFALAGCQQAEIAAPEAAQGSTFRLIANLPQTRTTLDGDTFEAAWEEGDIIYGVTTDEAWGKPYVSADETNRETIAQFVYGDGVFTTEATIAAGSHTFNFLYTTEKQMSYHRGAGSTYQLSSTQTQTGTSTAHIKTLDAIVGSVTATAPLTQDVVVDMNHIFSPILRQTYGMPLCEGSTTEYKSALFQFGAQVKANLKSDRTVTDAAPEGAVINGVYNIDFENSCIADAKTEYGSSINVKFVDAEIAAGASFPVYFVIAPLSNYSGKVTFKLTDSAAATYTKTASVSGLSFEAGKYNTASVSYAQADKADDVAKTLPYEEPFASSQGDFTISNVELDGLSYVWSWNSYKYMVASANVSSTNHATESWLISPWISLKGVSSATLSFDHTYKFAGSKEDEMSVMVTTNDEDWDKLTIPVWPTGSDWVFVNSGDIDLKAYAGSNVKIAFVYNSSATTAPKWEIKNVKVAEGSVVPPVTTKTFSLTKSTVDAGASATSASISVKGSASWTVSNVTSGASVDKTSFEGSTDDNHYETVKITFPANTTTSPKTYSCTFTTSDKVDGETSLTFTVNQSAAEDIGGSGNTDVITRGATGVEGTAYTEWAKTGNSGANYIGQSAGGKDAIQMRATSPSGIVANNASKYAKTVTIKWHPETAEGRKIDIYGAETAFTSPENLYNTTATKVATLAFDASELTQSYTFTTNYHYIGIRSNNGALYLEEIKVEWSNTQVGGDPQKDLPKLATPKLSSANVTETSFDVTWDAVANAVGYNVRVNGEQYGEDIQTATSVSLTGLTAGTEYSVTVVAKADGVNYNDSSVGSIKVSTKETAAAGKVTVVMADYAAANSWTTSAGSDVVSYLTVNIDSNVTMSVNEGGNNGSFWAGGQWRLYQNQAAVLTLTSKNGKKLKSVKFTYATSNGGTLKYSGNAVASTTEVALSGTMENLAGGLIILLFKPFKAGDFISVDGFSGTVTEVTIVSTKIATPDNRVVVIPNGSMSNGKIDNYSQRPTRRMDIKVNVEYGTDAEQCCNALTEIAKADPRVLTEPAPVSMLSQMKESDVEFVLRVWVKSEDYWDAWFALNKEVYTTLPKKGCPFAYPHMDVTVSSK